jgi:hypothetical protein
MSKFIYILMNNRIHLVAVGAGSHTWGRGVNGSVVVLPVWIAQGMYNGCQGWCNPSLSKSRRCCR